MRPRGEARRQRKVDQFKKGLAHGATRGLSTTTSERAGLEENLFKATTDDAVPVF